MFVCLCNALDDRQVRQAVRDGAHRPREVYAACGCRAQCGGCTKTLLGIIRGDASASHQAHENP
jgi:bacterioferritin-associated ferredoxin